MFHLFITIVILRSSFLSNKFSIEIALDTYLENKKKIWQMKKTKVVDYHIKINCPFGEIVIWNKDFTPAFWVHNNICEFTKRDENSKGDFVLNHGLKEGSFSRFLANKNKSDANLVSRIQLILI